MLKKVYIEITNNCNLNCTFCIKNGRPKRFMSLSEFEIILKKIDKHTKYLYFHVLGEPLLHPDINKFIEIASKNFDVNITTNGYLINRVKNNSHIRQINISLHSFDESYKISLDEYMNNIFDSIDELSKKSFISLRFWTHNKHANEMLALINNHYNTNLVVNNLKDNSTISQNIYLSISKEFLWPDLNNSYYDEYGSCLALKDHIGILVDGTIVPCCLDSKGTIKLGNIFKDELKDVFESDRYQRMLKGFMNNKKIELLCKKCPVKRNLKG